MTEQETGMTPLPWVLSPFNAVLGPQGEMIARVNVVNANTVAEGKANAAYIVRAANAYPALVAERNRLREALKELVGIFGMKPDFEREAKAIMKAQAALDAAEEGQDG